jgi:ubiquinone/menaquinone biosynthesis C-methylase UbiE
VAARGAADGSPNRRRRDADARATADRPRFLARPSTVIRMGGSSARRTWDSVARIGDHRLIGDPGRAAQELSSLFGRLGGSPEARRCIEVGCGTGRMTVELAKQFDQLLVADVSPAMVEQARAAVDGAGATGVEFVVVPGARLDGLPDDWGDVLVCYLVLQHLPSKRHVFSYFSEFARVLAPGGEAFVQLPVLTPSLRARAWRRIRHSAVLAAARLARAPRAQPSYKGFRLTSVELQRALEASGLETVRADRDDTSSYRFSREVFLRLRKPPSSPG